MYLKNVINKQLLEFVKEKTFLSDYFLGNCGIRYSRPDNSSAQIIVVEEKKGREIPKFYVNFTDFTCKVEGYCEEDFSKEWRHFMLGIVEKPESYKRSANKAIDKQIKEIEAEYAKKVLALQESKFGAENTL